MSEQKSKEIQELIGRFIQWLAWNRAIGDFTSFLLMFTTVFVSSMAMIYKIFSKNPISSIVDTTKISFQVVFSIDNIIPLWVKLFSVIVLLTANFMLLGQLVGFSILLIISLLTVGYFLLVPQRQI